VLPVAFADVQGLMSGMHVLMGKVHVLMGKVHGLISNVHALSVLRVALL